MMMKTVSVVYTYLRVNIVFRGAQFYQGRGNRLHLLNDEPMMQQTRIVNRRDRCWGS